MKEYHNRTDYNIKIWDEENKEHELKSKIITPAIADRLYSISQEKREDDNSISDPIIRQMVIIFGKDKEFYKKFDTFILKDVITDFTNEVILKKNKLSATISKSEQTQAGQTK